MTQTCLIDGLSRNRRLDTVVARSLTQAETQAPASIDPVEVAPGVFFLEGGTRYFRAGTEQGPQGSIRSLMCNNGWVVLGDEVLLVDANMPGRADVLLDAIRNTTDKPVRYLFNTHHHGDHVYGNGAIFQRTGCTITACIGMVEELRRYETGTFGGSPGRKEQVAKFRPDVAATELMLPDMLFERSLVFEGGGRRAELLHLGWGHTRGDAVLWLPRERVLFAGDLVTNGAYNIVRDAEMMPWISTLANLRALDPLSVCPGHGPMGQLALIDDQLSFFLALLRQVEKRIAAGLTREALLADLEDIRGALLAEPQAAEHVIPRQADLSVLSLQAQVERIYEQVHG
jgi:cyclase